MATVIVVGAQWGDEGKGKVVDLLSATADVVVRYAGGPNAGHTLMVGDEACVFRLVPSGVLHEHTECILGQGMVLNLEVLLEEIDNLGKKGIVVFDRLTISERAHVLTPYHVAIDELREAADGKIGTTKRGIGPCYEDKIGRRGLRMGDLLDEARTKEIVGRALDAWKPVAAQLGGELPSADDVCGPLLAAAGQLMAFVGDSSSHLSGFIAEGANVLLEGAQGTMLDIDHGTYPFVTSSSATAGGACTGAGIGPTDVDGVIGVTKAYATRVGGGPFPTELDGADAEHLQKVGKEFGSVTGRPRRTGWLDLPALRYAKRVNGIDGWVLTKLDVLTGLDTIKVCVGYEGVEDGDGLPAELEGATPIYRELPGWKDDISGARALSDLPEAARAYLDFIEEATDTPITMVSVGPKRDATIELQPIFDSHDDGVA